jgi:NAD(P)-dependent dehydrogenase (short-subunit alcohol dehydrogenase family)
MLLKGKSAIVTGGNSGIGKAIVLELAEQGANVAVDYVSRPDATEELEARIAALGDRAIGWTPMSARSPICSGSSTPPSRRSAGWTSW